MPTTYIGLLRGINVGGKRKLKMDLLRSAVAEAGWSDVTTYIQSGNVVFTGPKQAESTVASGLEQTIEQAAGFDVTVVVLTLAGFRSVLDKNPFTERAAEPGHLHYVFLRDKVDRAAIDRLDLPSFAPEELAVGDGVVYLHLPNGMGRSKLAQALTPKTVGGEATARNHNTVQKLVVMGEELGSG